jgi:predicted choloylglycine hydrolase
MVQKNDNKNVSGDGKKTYKNNLTNSKKTRMKKKKRKNSRRLNEIKDNFNKYGNKIKEIIKKKR